MNIKHKHKKSILLLILITGLIVFLYWQNNSLVINHICYKNDQIPEAFDHFQIVQVSDLHNKEFGKKQNRLLSKLGKLEPDIIVITGDLIDSNHTDLNAAMDFINGAITIAPLYYVSGNHEAWSGIYDDLRTQLEESGVIILENARLELKKSNDSIILIGLSDPSFQDTNWSVPNEASKSVLDTLTATDNSFQILLSHRPEHFNEYAATNVDLVFSGHAHGGQFRLPWIGGLIAPDQGLLPKLTEGVHTQNDTTMVISRGLGNSVIPFRIFNRPELVTVTLSK